MKFLIKALRGLAINPIKRRTAFKAGAAAVATGAAGPILKYTAPGAKQAFNRGYRAWANSDLIAQRGIKDTKSIRESRKMFWRDATSKDSYLAHVPRKHETWSGVYKARAARAQDLRRIRELKQLGKKPSELTRRSFLTTKKGTR